MEYYQKHNTSPFLHSMDCSSSSCPEVKLLSHCYWDEALFDCLHDFSSQHNDGDFQVNTNVSYVTSANTADHHYEENNGQGYGGHAALTYDDVEEAGPPARPQEFPIPYLHNGVRTTIQAMDHRTKNVRVVKNVLMALSNFDDHNETPTMDSNIVDKAYLLKKRISRSSYGNRYLSVVLRRRSLIYQSSSFDRENEKIPEDEWDTVQWESTEEFVTITVSPWSTAMQLHRRSLSRQREGPFHAIAAMQHVGSYHPNVLGLLAVFSDDQHLYTITPYHGGTDLQTKILANREQGEYKPNEPQARALFTQLLKGLFHLQRKGVCHTNLSLENIYVDSNNQDLVIADLGRSFRVPYNDPSNYGCLTGETEGTTRRLIRLLPEDFYAHPPENLMFLPPEVVENEEAFDGFGVDLWAASCILFVLLVGMAPFKTAHYWDAAYAEISSGNLKGLLASLHIHLSDEATTLLQNMFWRDPRDRLTLAQILDHPWIKNQRFPTRAPVTPLSSIRRTNSSGRISSADSASTTSNFEGDAERSAGSRKSFSKAITGLFGGHEKRDNERRESGGSAKGWGLLSSARHSGQKTLRSASLGGLSPAASSATAGSPATAKSAAGEDNGGNAFGVEVLQIPSLD